MTIGDTVAIGITGTGNVETTTVTVGGIEIVGDAFLVGIQRQVRVAQFGGRGKTVTVVIAVSDIGQGVFVGIPVVRLQTIGHAVTVAVGHPLVQGRNTIVVVVGVHVVGHAIAVAVTTVGCQRTLDGVRDTITVAVTTPLDIGAGAVAVAGIDRIVDAIAIGVDEGVVLLDVGNAIVVVIGIDVVGEPVTVGVEQGAVLHEPRCRGRGRRLHRRHRQPCHQQSSD